MLFAVLIAAGLVVLPEQAAHACSCVVITSPADVVARADGAFVGTFTGRDEAAPVAPQDGPVPSASRVVNHFNVEKAVKGDFGPTVDVASGTESSMCGIEFKPGQRVGLLLVRHAGEWLTGLCSVVPADKMLAATGPVGGSVRGPAAGALALLAAVALATRSAGRAARRRGGGVRLDVAKGSGGA